jgi:hypothetical protein
MSQIQRILLVLSSLWIRSISAGTTGLIDASGTLRVQSISAQDDNSNAGLVAVVTSPGTRSSLLPAETESTVSSDNTQCLWLEQQQQSSSAPCLLICRGATLSATSDAERISLSTCSLVADSVIVGGITLGDLQGTTPGGIRDSRHGRTLTALFRARVRLEGVADAEAADDTTTISASATKKQTLILPLPNVDGDDEDSTINLEKLRSEIQSLFSDVSLERAGTPSFDEMYTLEFMSTADAGKVRSFVHMWGIQSDLLPHSQLLVESLKKRKNISRPIGERADEIVYCRFS